MNESEGRIGSMEHEVQNMHYKYSTVQYMYVLYVLY